MTRKSRLWMIVTGIALFGFGLAGVSKIAQQVYHEDYQLSALYKWGNQPRVDEQWITEKAQYDFLAFTPGVWNFNSMKDAKVELQKENLDIMLGTYMWAFNVPRWAITQADAGMEGFPTEFYRAAEPFWAVTTEGDTATIWKDNPMFDLFNPECRTAVIQAMDVEIRRTGVDWMMLDFVSVPIPNLKRHQDPIYEDLEHGDLDFDRDGIGHWDDPDEQQQLRVVWDLYIEEMTATFPDNFLIIPNGNLAIKDPLFAKKVDGCFIEHYPEWFFGSFGANFPNGVNPEFPNSLWELSRSDRWRTSNYYVFIENYYNRYFYTHIATMFDRVVEIRPQLSDTQGPPMPQNLNTGKPLGDPVMQTNRIIREFENGNLIINNPLEGHTTYSFEEDTLKVQ